MKKTAYLLLLVMICFSHSASAADVQKEASSVIAWPSDLPPQISLLETTPLYAEPDFSTSSWASLTPQKVEVMGSKFEASYMQQADATSWLQIKTSWLGTMWVPVDNHKLGFISPVSLDLDLAADTPLYDQPFHESANGAVLSPQTVHAKAEFRSPSGFYALQIETAWRGDQWLINPELAVPDAKSHAFGTALNPDYGDHMTVNRLYTVHVGDRTYLTGQFTLDDTAWQIGRIHPGPMEKYVWGTISFWQLSGEIVTSAPYAIYNPEGAGHGVTSPLLIPVDNMAETAQLATLQNTFPYYFGLPLPPFYQFEDDEGKALLGILHMQKNGDFTVARAWISGKVAGAHMYDITLSFYDKQQLLLGQSHIHQRLIGPQTPQVAGSQGEGTPYLIDLIGTGDWSSYDHAVMHVDHIAD
ncbi:hypothetical protein [Paenibacillus aestuarii]|uniref:Uncharacterized protein n=1 Tax=Paenibacillus aestuarii TaxID=516965 RepID=A0ABW0KBQ7_9BACL|nr:hypothetical protein [Paenibacillus aestuarii]